MKRLLKNVASFVMIILFVFLTVRTRDLYWQSHPEKAFLKFTGKMVPSGVQVKAYAWQMNDNILHKGHYFWLQGNESDLERFVIGTSLKESTEDAKWILSNTSELFELSQTKEQIKVGYEDDSLRNNWYWIFANASDAIYNQN